MVVEYSNFNDSFNDNMVFKSNSLEKKQLYNLEKNINNLELLHNFNELTFSSNKNVIPQNVNNNYTNFKSTDNMTYNIINQNKLTHNNMNPFSIKRDLTRSMTKSQRSLELFTGQLSEYTKKKEIEPLFKPVNNYGDVLYFNSFVKNRLKPSIKNNDGILPFKTNLKVSPGINNEKQKGRHNVYRINPLNIDEFKNDNHKQQTYINKPLETVKKGNMRSIDPNITKFKVKDFIEKNFTDLLPTRSDVNLGRTSKEFTNMMTKRNISATERKGPKNNSAYSDTKNHNNILYSDVKKENYLNDSLRSAKGSIFPPNLSNDKSIIRTNNNRNLTNSEYFGNAVNNQKDGYTIDYNNIPNKTIKETLLKNNTGYSIKGNSNNYIKSNNMEMSKTNRQTLNQTEQLGVTNIGNSVKINNIDKAKKTIKEDTTHDIIINTTSQNKVNKLYNKDELNPTIRQSTSTDLNTFNKSNSFSAPLHNKNKLNPTIRQLNNKVIVTNSNQSKSNVPIYNKDIAKNTIKSQTSINTKQNMLSCQNSIYSKNNDKLKPTIKESTTINNTIGSIKNNNLYYINDNISIKNTIRETLDNKNAVNINSNQTSYYNNQKKLNNTIKELTEHNNYISNINNINGEYTKSKNDIAKATLRQLKNSDHVILGNNDNKSYITSNDSIIKPTIKETTIYNNIEKPLKGSNSIYLKNNDIAKYSIKEDTIYNNYIGNVKSNIENKNISHEAVDNMTSNLKKESVIDNRNPNGSNDMYRTYIDEDTVNLKNDNSTEYFNHPHISVGKAINDKITSKNDIKIKQTKINDGMINTYYTDSDNIIALKNNPLVNNKMHLNSY